MVGFSVTPLLGISQPTGTGPREHRPIPADVLHNLPEGALLEGKVEELLPDGKVLLNTKLGVLQFKAEAALLRHLQRGSDMLIRLIQQPGQDLPAIRPLTVSHIPVGQLTRPTHSPDATLPGQPQAEAELRKPEGYNHLRQLSLKQEAQQLATQQPLQGNPPAPRLPIGSLLYATLSHSSPEQQQLRDLLVQRLQTFLAPASPPASTAMPADTSTALLPTQASSQIPPSTAAHTAREPAPALPTSPASPTVTGHSLPATHTQANGQIPPSTAAHTAREPAPALPASPASPAVTGHFPLATPAQTSIHTHPATPASGNITAPTPSQPPNHWFLRILSYGAPTGSASALTSSTSAPPSQISIPPSQVPPSSVPPSQVSSYVPVHSQPSSTTITQTTPASPTPFLLPQTILSGQVQQLSGQPHPQLITPIGTFQLAPNIPLQDGEQFQFTLEPITTPNTPPAALAERLPRWHTLEQLMQQLGQHLPILLPALEQRLPRMNNLLLDTTLLFLVALKGSQPLTRWLGEDIWQQLQQKQELQPLLQRLQGELQQLGQSLQQLPQTAPDQPWNLHLTPFWTEGGEVRPLLIYQRKEGKLRHEDGTATQHFLLELEFRHTGPLQLEGLWRGPENPTASIAPRQLSLILRSLRPLPNSLTQALQPLYQQLMQGFGFQGTFRQETIPQFTTDALTHHALEQLSHIFR